MKKTAMSLKFFILQLQFFKSWKKYLHKNIYIKIKKTLSNMFLTKNQEEIFFMIEYKRQFNIYIKIDFSTSLEMTSTIYI